MLGIWSKESVAGFLIRFPWIVELSRFAYRWTQAQYTAGVVGVIRNNEDRILVVKHVYHPHAPWGLPGGWLGRRENPATGLQREIREETGIEVTVKTVLMINNGYMRQHLDVAFLCDAQSDVIRLSNELLDYQWLDVEEIPELLPFHRAAVEKYKTIGQFYARSEPSIS